MVKSIYLQDGEEIFVDDEDYERVSQYKWHKVFSGNTRSITTIPYKEKDVFLKDFIKKNSFQKIKNNDFTKNNLIDQGESFRWKRANAKSDSKYKGVSFHKKTEKWRSNIKVEGKQKYLGLFESEDEAALAYNQAVLEFLDGNAYMNIIGQDNRVQIRDYKTHDKQKITGGKKFRGVGIDGKSFFGVICYNYNTCRTGSFRDERKAALTYNKCALYLHGDDAILNDVPMTDKLKEFISNWEIPEKVKALKEGATSE
ncbi:AP2 domain-containing protein [Staphylococcus saprophyticus]|uniref:AP2 domain-containing protein n=1 Tax=Staphylococcus saprophyticus TaxID=29385 RepID=UPI0021A65782|nr:AP2 domain-containing protein [Staphylococcus saprophyticus]MCT1652600.1 AP2 domain-containing protein [Staphylococcus saprophyticus]